MWPISPRSDDTMTRACDMLFLIVVLTILARAKSEYHYQHPNIAFQPPNQQFIQGRPPENVQHAQGFLNSFQQLYDRTSSQSQNIQSAQFQRYEVTNQRPSFASSNNYYQGYVQNSNSVASQSAQQNLNSINLNSVGPSPLQPVVMKHIYYHIPPPDVEASVASEPVKKKKTYNIVFIKVPAQQPRYSPNAQGFTSKPYAPVEERTIIYVLVKKPEDYQQGRGKAPPNHEVYYVKYKGTGSGAAAQINNQLPDVTPGQHLLPGLVNGQH